MPVRVTIPSPLHSSRLAELNGTLTRLIGNGRSGAVYALELSTLSTGLHSVPPLVVKFALRKRNKDMLREAWFYDELQSLQGTVVPRCYGYYEAKVPPNCTVIPWKTVEDRDREINSGEFDDDMYAERGTFNSIHQLSLARFDEEEYATILLLEALGEPFLPIRQPISEEIMSVRRYSMSLCVN